MRKSDITKQKILKAAECVFSERGYYGASVNDIADTAGVNKRMIYAHFENKEKLYIAVIDEEFKRISDAEDTLLGKSFDCAEAVCEIIEHYFNFFAKNKMFVKIVVRENLNEGAFFKKTSARFVKSGAAELLKSKIRQGVETGAFKSGLDAEETAFIIIGMCLSCFSNVYLPGAFLQQNYTPDIKRLCEKTKEICIGFLKT